LPRFFGITKTFRPVLRLPELLEPPEPEPELPEPELPEPELPEPLDDEEQAASSGAATRSGTASHVARLSFIF
jgi:hypothetical protein